MNHELWKPYAIGDNPSIENKENKENTVGLTEKEIQKWNMELRRNNICMDEHNADMRMKKIKESEENEIQRIQDRNRIYEEGD